MTKYFKYVDFLITYLHMNKLTYSGHGMVPIILKANFYY